MSMKVHFFFHNFFFLLLYQDILLIICMFACESLIEFPYDFIRRYINSVYLLNTDSRFLHG